MKFNYECLQCNLNQALKVSDVMGLSDDMKETIVRKVLRLLAEVDYNQANPVVMAQTWALIAQVSGEPDPYRLFKLRFNESLYGIRDQIREEIEKHEDNFYSYMYGAILGNIIDLGPGHEIEYDHWLQAFIKEMSKQSLTVDDSRLLQAKVSSAKKLLYIGDNCGEIVLDQLFIEYMKESYPELEIIFSVREAPVLNDITMEDAIQVGLDKLVKVISTGGMTPGVVMTQTSEEFRQVFKAADVIIAKGQGNYEGLSDLSDERIHFLLMVKCQLLADQLNVPIMSRMCSVNRAE